MTDDDHYEGALENTETILLFIPCHRKYCQSEYSKAIVCSMVFHSKLPMVCAHICHIRLCCPLHCAGPENIHTPSHQKELEFPGGGGSVTPKNLKKCVKLYLNFQRGGGLRKYPFCGGGMDIFWNYTFSMAVGMV